jgi:glutamine amidotransferase
MGRPSIVIIDYQAGNLRSVQKAVEANGVSPRISSDPREIEDADGLIFPGQGANDSSMRQLRARNLVEPVKDFIESGKPFLGVCLGLQLLLESSEEGVEPCLGVLKGKVRRLPEGQKIPHMGWNQVEISSDHPVFDGITNNSYFYFVHSYYADPEDRSILAGETRYGLDFCSAVARDNMAAVQFHPEKSGASGLKIYRNFIDLVETQN